MIFFSWFDRTIRKIVPKHVWEDQVYSKVMAALIYTPVIAILATIFYFIYGAFKQIPFLESLKTLGVFLIDLRLYYNWFIIILILCTIGFIITLRAYIKSRKSRTVYLSGDKLKKLKKELDKEEKPFAEIAISISEGLEIIRDFFPGTWQSTYSDGKGFGGHCPKLYINNKNEWMEENRKTHLVFDFKVISEKGMAGENVGDEITFFKHDVRTGEKMFNRLEVIVPFQHYKGYEKGYIEIEYKKIPL